MNIDAKAREVASKIQKDCKAYIPLECDAIIAAALLAARNEALEKAAKVADASVYEGSTGPYGETVNITSEAIATAIRALKERT